MNGAFRKHYLLYCKFHECMSLWRGHLEECTDAVNNGSGVKYYPTLTYGCLMLDTFTLYKLKTNESI